MIRWGLIGRHDKLKFVGQSEVLNLKYFLAEATGVEPAHDNARRFSKPLPYQLGDASRNNLLLRVLAGTLGFEPRKAGLEADGLPVSLRPNEIAD